MKLVSSVALLAVANANQVVRFDDPKFLLSGVFSDNDFDPESTLDKFFHGRWCNTLDTFSYPLKSDDYEYLQTRPVERLCKQWRECRMRVRRREVSCNQINYRTQKARGVNQQGITARGGFFANNKLLTYGCDRVDFSNPLHQKADILAGHVCISDYNETPCLEKTCECDLTLADSALNYIVDFYKQEILTNEQSEPVVEIVAEKIEQEKAEEEEVKVVTVEDVEFEDKLEEVVSDHAALVEEHDQLVSNIEDFKEKVTEIVEEHTERQLDSVRDNLLPVVATNIATPLTDVEAIQDLISETEQEIIENTNEEQPSSSETEQVLVDETAESESRESPRQLADIDELSLLADKLMQEHSANEEADAVENDKDAEALFQDVAAFNMNALFESDLGSIKK